MNATPGAGAVTVTGTTAPGASVEIAATLSPAGATDPGGTAQNQPVPTAIRQVMAAQDGSFSVTVPLAAGGYVVSAAATHAGATGHVQQSAGVS